MFVFCGFTIFSFFVFCFVLLLFIVDVFFFVFVLLFFSFILCLLFFYNYFQNPESQGIHHFEIIKIIGK